MKESFENEFLTKGEFAAMLGVSQKTIGEWLKQQRIVGVQRIGSRFMIKKNAMIKLPKKLQLLCERAYKCGV
jgi:excisionase family DNA binding protein